MLASGAFFRPPRFARDLPPADGGGGGNSALKSVAKLTGTSSGFSKRVMAIGRSDMTEAERLRFTGRL